MHNILIFGGTFDPVHNAHLTMAEQAVKQLKAQACYWVPNKIPLLKHSACATPEQRCDMLKLALSESIYANRFFIDLCEIQRDSPSYMVDTLVSFRKKFGREQPISLLMGEDAFAGLHKWHDWHQLITLAHFVIAERKPSPEASYENPLTETYLTHQTDKLSQLKHAPAGCIYKFTFDINISSTLIRESQLNLNLCPVKVQQYIEHHQLYQAY